MQAHKLNRRQLISQYGALIGLILLMIILTAMTKGDFSSARNLTNLFRQTALNGILACGMTVIIITGGIDLSVGSIVALAGVVVGLSQTHPSMDLATMGMLGAFLSLIIGAATGTATGALTGGLISKLGIAPFVISLGMMVIARGLAMIFSDGAAISPMSDQLNQLANHYFEAKTFVPIAIVVFAVVIFLAFKKYGSTLKSKPKFWIGLLIAAVLIVMFANHKGFPSLLVFLIIIAAISHYLLQHTVFGRSVYAIGSNTRAAEWAGVQIKKRLVQSYVLMGAYSGLVGVLLSARLNSADPNAGQLFELDAIAAVVIGGTNLKGGQGTIFGTLVGALMIATLNNGMDLLSVPSFYQMVCKGIIIIVASFI